MMLLRHRTWSGCGRYCCKSPKLSGANFSAVKKLHRRPLIRVPSIALPRSSASLSLGDEVPHIFARKSRLKPGKFLITSAKRLLQQNLPAADIRGARPVRGLLAPPSLRAMGLRSNCGRVTASRLSFPRQSWRESQTTFAVGQLRLHR